MFMCRGRLLARPARLLNQCLGPLLVGGQPPDCPGFLTPSSNAPPTCPSPSTQADFGLSKHKYGTFCSNVHDLRGTLPYMAPEMIMDHTHVTGAWRRCGCLLQAPSGLALSQAVTSTAALLHLCRWWLGWTRHS
jgi:hypothetical protein